jgi:hypothetical protein
MARLLKVPYQMSGIIDDNRLGSASTEAAGLLVLAHASSDNQNVGISS